MIDNEVSCLLDAALIISAKAGMFNLYNGMKRQKEFR